VPPGRETAWSPAYRPCQARALLSGRVLHRGRRCPLRRPRRLADRASPAGSLVRRRRGRGRPRRVGTTRGRGRSVPQRATLSRGVRATGEPTRRRGRDFTSGRIARIRFGHRAHSVRVRVHGQPFRRTDGRATQAVHLPCPLHDRIGWSRVRPGKTTDQEGESAIRTYCRSTDDHFRRRGCAGTAHLRAWPGARVLLDVPKESQPWASVDRAVTPSSVVNPPSPDGPPQSSDDLGVARPGDSDVNYAGAIYGSLLAASTVVGTAAAGTANVNSVDLLTALLATSMVFWLLHVYVRVVGVELPRHVPWFDAARRSVGHELPILLSVIPPAVAVLLTMAANEPGGSVGWWALWVAVGEQVLWTWIAVRHAHAGRGLTLLSLVVSVTLGLVLVALKGALGH
jgi:hypothetical protein